MSSTTTNLTNINFMSESKYDSLTEIHDDELYAVKIDGLDGEQIINQNPNEDPVKVWTGTQQEYDALEEYDASTIYNITDGVGGDTIATTNGNNTFTGTNNFVTPALNDNTTKVATTAWVNATINNKMSLTLLDFKWTDHILNNISWLRADTFSWQDGGVYEAAYNHLVADYNSIEESIYGITNLAGDFYRYSEGDVTGANHPYCWKDTNGYNCYTNTETPSVGDGTFVGSSGMVSDGAVESVIYAKQSYLETIGSYTITYYLADDGHKIVMPDQETTVQNIYNESGVAWYYILDISNQRFKLPRINPTREELIQVIRAKGNGMSLGLTDGAINKALVGFNNAPYTSLNASTNGFGQPVGSSYTADGVSSGKTYGITTDPAKSGIISSMTDSTSIYKGKKYLYFYVGQYTQSATEQTAGLNSEMFIGKADVDLSNAASNASVTAKQTIVGWGKPDFSAEVSISSPYTPTQNGFISICVKGAYSTINFNVDGVNVITEYTDVAGANQENILRLIPVIKGKEYSWSYVNGTLKYAKFMPDFGGII